MERPEDWDGYNYPEGTQKVWISFSRGKGGRVIALISQGSLIDTTGKGSVPITVYAAVYGDWAGELEARTAANMVADQVIADEKL